MHMFTHHAATGNKQNICLPCIPDHVRAKDDGMFVSSKRAAEPQVEDVLLQRLPEVLRGEQQLFGI